MNMQQPSFEPDFERVRTTLLRLGEPDHVPMVEFTVWAGHKARVLGHSPGGIADDIEFARRVGYDHAPFNVGLQMDPAFNAALEGRRHKVEAQGDEEASAQTVERRWAVGAGGVIKSHADFEAFPWPDPDAFDYTPLEEAPKLLPGNMKVIVQIGKVFNPVWWLMGFEAFSFALYDDPDLVARMSERIGSIQVRALERSLEYDCVGAYLHADDLAFNTALLVSRPVLQQYAYPWFRRMADLTHQAGRVALFHSDGNLDTVLEDLIDLGYDAVHPIDPGAMDIVRTKAAVRGRLGLLGNIDLRTTLPLGTPLEVEAEVAERIRTLGPGGGWCLSSANSIPDYVPFGNFAAMQSAWLKYGKYPINVM